MEIPASTEQASRFMRHENAMVHIRWNRVLLGGLVWFGVYNVLTAGAWRLFLQSESLAPFHPLLSQPFRPAASVIAYFLELTLMMGIFATWFYAAIRPRYAPGPRTAACAGLAMWFFWGLIQNLGWLGSIPPRLFFMEMAAKLVVIVLATLAGAWAYQE